MADSGPAGHENDFQNRLADPSLPKSPYLRSTGGRGWGTEGDLIQRAQAGDEEAFAALCEREAGRLRARAEQILSPAIRRKVAPSDVVQEAYVLAHQRLQDFEDRGDGAFGAWLARIVDLKAREAVRRYAGTAKRAVGAEVTEGRLGAALNPGRGPSPSQVVQAAETGEAIRRAIEALPDDYRLTIHLIQAEGLTIAAAAERMGRSRDSVKGLYARALKQVAAELGYERRGRRDP